MHYIIQPSIYSQSNLYHNMWILKCFSSMYKYIMSNRDNGIQVYVVQYYCGSYQVQ
jgi:hypothetical protein